jgi:hypothetical protein
MTPETTTYRPGAQGDGRHPVVLEVGEESPPIVVEEERPAPLEPIVRSEEDGFDDQRAGISALVAHRLNHSLLGLPCGAFRSEWQPQGQAEQALARGGCAEKFHL